MLPVLDLADAANGRLYRAPPVVPDRKWERTRERISLQAGATTIASEVWLGWRGIGVAATLTILGFALFAMLATILSFHSLKRLLFLDILEARKTWRAVASEERLLVLFRIEGMPAALAEKGWLDLACESVGDDQCGFIQVDVQSPDAAQLRDKVVAAETARQLMVLSQVDILRRAPASERDKWAEALRDFRTFAYIAPSPFADLECTPGLDEWAPLMASLWTESDDDERRVLTQLAIDGYANPHPANVPTIIHLRGRGLLDPETLAVCSPEFARFIRNSVSIADLQKWDGQDGDSAWNAMRVPLSAAVVLLLGFAGISAPQLAAVGPMIPTLAAGLPTLARVLATLANVRRI
jgi:hypothetical protein